MALILQIHGKKYDASSFAKSHPGGNIIHYYNHLDATEAFLTFHSKSKNLTSNESFRAVGRLSEVNNPSLMRIIPGGSGLKTIGCLLSISLMKSIHIGSAIPLPVCFSPNDFGLSYPNQVTAEIAG